MLVNATEMLKKAKAGHYAVGQLWDAVPIWFLYSSVLDVERCADLFLYIVFFGHWAECTFASIVCSLRLNFQPGMWQRYGQGSVGGYC